MDVERGDEMIAALRNLAAHTGVELPASPFVMDADNPTDVEIAAAIERGLATGQLVDAAEDLAQQDDDAQAEHDAAGPEHAAWCAGPMAHVREFANCGVCLTRRPVAEMTQHGPQFVCAECSPADLAAHAAPAAGHQPAPASPATERLAAAHIAAVRAALSDAQATYDATLTNGSGTRHVIMAGTQATVWSWCCRAGEQPGNLAGDVPVGIAAIGSAPAGPFVAV